jgi:(p)ppGpp synthase/HD superfamily hydrolase
MQPPTEPDHEPVFCEPVFDPGIERALRAAESAHRGQSRKSADTPYVLHPIHSALMLARLGCASHVIQAALLHDVVEDCAHAGWDHARIEREFGPRIAGIVAELTEDKAKSWEERKRAGIEHVAHMSPDARTVKAADKLHNLSTLAAELEATQRQSDVWARFTGGRARTLAMSRALVEALAPHVDPRLGNALLAAMEEVERSARA